MDAEAIRIGRASDWLSARLNCGSRKISGGGS